MKAETAVAFICSGTTLLLLTSRAQPLGRRVGALLAVGVLALAGWILLQHATGHDGVDVTSPGGVTTDNVRGHMAVLTAACFALAGIDLLLLLAPRQKRVLRWSEVLCLTIALIAYVSLVSVAFAPEGRVVRGPLEAMAVPTALGLMVLVLGLLSARGLQGSARYLADQQATTRLTRMVIAAAVVLPVVLQLLTKTGSQFVDFEAIGLSEASVSVAATGVLTVTLAAVMLRRLAALSERERQASDRYRLLADTVEDLVVQSDAAGPVVYASPSLTKVLGYTPQEIVGSKMLDLLHPDDLDRIASERKRMVESAVSRPLRARYRHKNGTFVCMESRTTPVRGDGGAVTSLVSIMRDVSAQVKAEQELQESEQKHRELSLSLEKKVMRRTEALAAANRELESFTYSVSHDLRAPLRAMDGYSKILLDECASALPEQGKHYLAMVEASANEMSQLVDALLALSRAGQQDLKSQAIDSGQLVNQVVESLKPSWGDRAVDLRVSSLPTIQGDQVLLRQVFFNLLSNAIKFTRDRDPASIEVDAERMDNRIVFSVRDNGVGFEMKYANKLFGIFQRLHHTEDFEGNGVGLALTQRIVQRHGGRVWAEAEPGKGASFFVSLPEGAPM